MSKAVRTVPLSLALIALAACSAQSPDSVEDADQTAQATKSTPASEEPPASRDGHTLTAEERALFTTRLQCGDTVVEFAIIDAGTADMRIANTAYAMKAVETASGARYENTGNPDTVFWNQGNKAMVTVDGEDLPECTVLPDEDTSASATGEAGGGHWLRGITWVLVTMNGEEAIGSELPTALFADEGRVSGSAGCNRFNGSYTLEGNRIAFNPAMAATKRMCAPEELMRQEDAFLTALPGMSEATVNDDGHLELGDGGNNSLVFRRGNGS
ncbi:MAG: META domain-containing protein [Pseudomonadota bacterium]